MPRSRHIPRTRGPFPPRSFRAGTLIADAPADAALTLVIPVATADVTAPAPTLVAAAVEPVATSTTSAPAPVFATAAVVGASGVSTSTPAPTTTVSTPIGSPGGTTSTPSPAPAAAYPVPAATVTATAPAPILDTGGATLTLTIPTATVTATAPAPTLTTEEAAAIPVTVGGGSPFGYALAPPPIPTPIKPAPQEIVFAIPAAWVYATATPPILRIEEDLFSELEAWLAEADEIAALAYLSPV